MGSISSNVQNDLEGSLIIYKGKRFALGYFCELSPKLVVYYILDYFGILFILDLNSVLREFILWDQRLLKRLFCETSDGRRYCSIIFSLS